MTNLFYLMAELEIILLSLMIALEPNSIVKFHLPPAFTRLACILKKRESESNSALAYRKVKSTFIYFTLKKTAN